VPGEGRASENNLQAYEALYNIENSIRELIILKLSEIAGPYWYKSRLPGDVLNSYRQGLRYEKSQFSLHFVPHHPIYYTDFPDLRKVVVRDDNWNDVFKELFKRKDIFEATLSQLEPIRNKIAHNRRVSNLESSMVSNFLGQLTGVLGQSLLDTLSNHPTIEPEIGRQLLALEAEMTLNYDECRVSGRITSRERWNGLRKVWWFDETYLGDSVVAIKNFACTIDDYEALPRGRGKGHILESFILERDLNSLFNEWQTAMKGLLGGWS
jgi:hypothetical protein